MSLNIILKRLLSGGSRDEFSHNGYFDVETIDLNTKLPFQNELQFLYENLELKIGHLDRKLISVASSTAQEGTSTIACYYALKLARGRFLQQQSGNGNSSHRGDVSRDILLIDANFRHPSIHRMFNMENHYGFTELLQSEIALEECVYHLQDHNLNIITAGQAIEQPIKEFQPNVINNLIDKIRHHFSYVIIDSAPVLSNRAILAIMKLCDGMVLTVKAETTKREVIQKARSKLDEAQVNILGVVLNRREYHIPKFIYDNI